MLLFLPPPVSSSSPSSCGWCNFADDQPLTWYIRKEDFSFLSACLPHPQSQRILLWGEGRKEGRKTHHPIPRRHRIQKTSKFLLHPLGLCTFLCFLPVLFPTNIVWIFPIFMAATAAAIEWFCWNVAMKLLELAALPIFPVLHISVGWLLLLPMSRLLLLLPMFLVLN